MLAYLIKRKPSYEKDQNCPPGINCVSYYRRCFGYQKTRGGQQFYAVASQPAVANEPIVTALDQSNPPSIECTLALAPYVCTIATKSSAPFYNPGDAISRT